MTVTTDGASKVGTKQYGSKAMAVVIGLVMAAGLAFLALWPVVLVTIPPGHVGVLYNLLSRGTISDHVYPEGLALKLPWNQMFLFETRVQAVPFRTYALTAEGMSLVIEGTTLFHLQPQKTPALLRQVGLDYVERIVVPMSIAAVRQEAAQHDSQELYTVSADHFQARVMSSMRQTPQSDMIRYQEVVVRQIALPASITAAIEAKLAAEQKAASYEFLLASERLEAERRRIQAIGLRNFYAIVQSSLTDRLLTWRGIEATVELSKSPNTKIVVVGGNRDQLPLILGSDITRSDQNQEPSVTPIPSDSYQLPDWSSEPPLFGTPQDQLRPRGQFTAPNTIGQGKSEQRLVTPRPSAAPPGNGAPSLSTPPRVDAPPPAAPRGPVAPQ